MKQKNCITSKKKYTHLSERERYKLEILLEAKKKIEEIVLILGRDRSTIYREIKRGSVDRIQHDLRSNVQYRANVGQNSYIELGRNKERSLKIGKDREFEEYIRKKLLEDKFSPDAIIGEIKLKRIKFKGMICAKTLYNYIDAGIFSGISNDNLWEKRKKKKRKYRKISRISLRNRDSRSIEERLDYINLRLEYGHWEGDCVKSHLGGKAGLLTLTERKTLEEIIIKLDEITQEEVQKALDYLEKKYGVLFKIKFKSITFDNGSEFLNWRALELSVLDKNKQRTVTYFAHAYSSWERGTNENQNRMIRRFIPKGTDIAYVSEKEVEEIEIWMNNYPRKKLGYKTPNELVKEHLQNKIDFN